MYDVSKRVRLSPPFRSSVNDNIGAFRGAKLLVPHPPPFSRSAASIGKRSFGREKRSIHSRICMMGQTNQSTLLIRYLLRTSNIPTDFTKTTKHNQNCDPYLNHVKNCLNVPATYENMQRGTRPKLQGRPKSSTPSHASDYMLVDIIQTACSCHAHSINKVQYFAKLLI